MLWPSSNRSNGQAETTYSIWQPGLKKVNIYSHILYSETHLLSMQVWDYVCASNITLGGTACPMAFAQSTWSLVPSFQNLITNLLSTFLSNYIERPALVYIVNLWLLICQVVFHQDLLKEREVLLHCLLIYCAHLYMSSTVTTLQCEPWLTFKEPSPPFFVPTSTPLSTATDSTMPIASFLVLPYPSWVQLFKNSLSSFSWPRITIMGYPSTDTILQCFLGMPYSRTAWLMGWPPSTAFRAANICSFVHILHLLNFLDRAGGPDFH